MQPKPEPAPIVLRVHTRIVGEKPRKERGDQGAGYPGKWANFALVFDCETTRDLREDLNFLWWRFCELKGRKYVGQREGLVYADGLDRKSVALIKRYARGKPADVESGCPENILVQSRTEFVDGEFWEACRTGAVIACFNAPFDLTRLALEYGEAKRKDAGWSLVLWNYKGKPDELKPRLTIKPKDSRSAFIRLAGGDPHKQLVYGGRFLDLSVLGWALRNKHLDLNGFLRSFRLKGKMKHEPTGRVSKRELAYGRKDVERTVALLNAMKCEYDGFPLKLPPEQAMSAASITKAFLDAMRITEPEKKFKLPDDIVGKCMQAYYGGRSEIRIRHHEVPVVVCDTTSEYPSVAVLLRLWWLLVAEEVAVEDCTVEARKALRRANLKNLLDSAFWPKLAFFASIKPGGDVLPVRAHYGENGEPNIGLNPLTSKETIWYAGPDLAGSRLKTGHAPGIIQAFRIVPRGTQLGMKPSSIGTREIKPAEHDLFQAVIEERKKLPKKHPHHLLLKIIANALYGIFAELNKNEYGKNSAKQMEVHSGEHRFTETTTVVERPGRWHFTPAAALITAGGRLMLAVLESMVEKQGGSYLLTDTDSMFIVASQRGKLVPCPGGPHRTRDGKTAVKALSWEGVQRIAKRLNSLNPYKDVPDILKIEDCNRDRAGNLHQLYGLAISAKRYVVYRRRGSARQIIKPSEHGLGIVYVPDARKRTRYKPANCRDRETDYARWIVEAWEHLLDDHFTTLRDPENALVARPLWFADIPAMMRVRITTPNVMKALRKRDPDAAKPYNFAQSPLLADPVPGCTFVAPSSKHPKEWLTRDYTEINSGDTVRIGDEYRGTKLVPQTLSTVLWRHYQHREDKSLGPDGRPCNEHTSGLLLRRPIEAVPPFEYIGKEIERRAQEGEDISLLEGTGPIGYQPRQTLKTRAGDPTLILRARRFSQRQLRDAAKVSQHAVERFLRAERVHPATREQLGRAVETLERKGKENES